MPLNRKNKIAFIHIPKAAGSSIEIALNMFGFNNSGSNQILDTNKMFGKTHQHMTINELREKAEKTILDFDSYHKFTIVRNPEERMLSEFFWRQKWDEKAKKMNFLDFLHQHLSNISIKKYNFENRHFIKQGDFIDNTVSVFRLEDEMDNLRSYLSNIVGHVNIGTHNTTVQKEDFWSKNKEALLLIRDVYSSDYDLFGYQN